MRRFWLQLSKLSPDFLTLVKRYTPAAVRFWIRQRCGANYQDIVERDVILDDGRIIRIERDPIYWPIDHGMEYEPELTHIVRRVVRTGDTVVDAGANFGWYATVCGRIVAPGGRVYAFEPVSRNYRRLLVNIELNRLARIVVAVHAGLSDASGARTIHYPNDTEGAYASLTPASAGWKGETVRVVSLDEFLGSSEVRQVDVLKGDVEGAELLLLNGSASLLRDDKAPILILELNGEALQRFGNAKIDVWHLLRGAGYDRFYGVDFRQSIYRVKDSHRFARLENCLACKGDTLEARLSGSDIRIRG